VVPTLRVLPLCSQVAFPSQAGDAVFGTPRIRILLPGPPLPACRRALVWLDSLRDEWFPLRAPVAKPGPLDGFSMVRYRQELPTALTHSSNCRPWADCVRLHRWKPHPWDVTRLAVGFGAGRTFGSCCPAPPLAARLPFRITVLVRPRPGEPVTYASRGIRP
jgi:hypothetical protein